MENLRFQKVTTNDGIVFYVGIPDEVEDTDMFLDEHLTECIWSEPADKTIF